MTFDELTASLPNGVHDAELEKVEVDFTKREARLQLDLWVGDDEDKEAYRRGLVTLTGVLFWVCEPPDPGYPFGRPESVRIDGGPLSKDFPNRQPALPPVPPNVFINWLFVNEWNAFIYFAASDASLTWLGDRTVREY